MKRGLALILAVVTAGVILHAGVPAPPGDVVAGARLKTITARAHGKGASLVIETTEPVGYVATQPDPLTIAIDFRNVTADGVSNGVLPDPNGAIAGVSVERVESLGAPAARVHISLRQPVVHHVRSDRSSIIIDLDGPTGRPYVLPASGSTPRVSAADTAAVVDPIVALGLNESTTAPSGSGAAILRNVAVLQQGAAQAQAPPPAPAPTLALPAAPPAVAPGAPQAQGQGAPARRFTGNPISLDFQGADLRAVLRTFADISGLNIVIDPQVQGTVDVALRDVPWDQALDIILRANRLGYSLDGTIVRVAPLATLATEEKERTDLAKAQADAGQLNTLTRQLSYSKGEEIVSLLKQANVLSSRGTPYVDTRTNTLILTDLQDRLTSATALIDQIDKPQPQVEIEARIVQTNKSYARALGIQWGFNGAASPQLGNTTNLAFPNSVAIGGRVGSGTGATQGSAGATATTTAVNLAAAAATSGVGLTLGSINGAFNLDLALSALENSGNGKLLSTPKVSTLNNVAAEMTQGVQIPIQTVANNTVTVTFKDAALTLKVIPQITAANTVIMQVALENATPDFSKSVNNIPPINTQRANTTVLVNDGQTTVIGGIYTSQTTNQRDNTPGLGNVPLLGWLFRRDQVSDQNTELLIFITPRIVK